jgi:hypothetical protein
VLFAALVVGQVALSLALLAGSGLFLRALQRARAARRRRRRGQRGAAPR